MKVVCFSSGNINLPAIHLSNFTAQCLLHLPSSCCVLPDNFILINTLISYLKVTQSSFIYFSVLVVGAFNPFAFKVIIVMYVLFFNFIYFFIQQVLISYPFYTHQCTLVNPNLPIHHTTTTPTPTAFPPCCPYICSLHLCLYFCPANRLICTIFLGSTYMR